MRRVTAIRRVGLWDGAAVDRVVLDAGDRQRRRIVLTGEKGTMFLLDLATPETLRDGDGLVLDDGGIVQVAGQPELLVEVAANTPVSLVRFAWHLGNRHIGVQIVGDRLRIRRDRVLEEMLVGLGAHLMAIEAPFDPEPGAGLDHDARHWHDHG